MDQWIRGSPKLQLIYIRSATCWVLAQDCPVLWNPDLLEWEDVFIYTTYLLDVPSPVNFKLALSLRHAEESLKIIAEERGKRMGLKSSVSSSKSVTSPTVRLCFPWLLQRILFQAVWQQFPALTLS